MRDVVEYSTLVLIGVMLIGLGLFLLLEGLRMFGWIGPAQIVLDPECWICTKFHEETRTILVWVGKSPLPMVNTEQVCDKYERKEQRDA